MFPIEKSPKISYKFFCENCHYKCCKKSEYIKHTLTNKHKILQNPTSNAISNAISNATQKYECNCGKIYKHSSTLYTHKKKYNHKEINDVCKKSKTDITQITPELIMQILKQNSELTLQNSDLTNKIFDICKNGTHNTINNTNNTDNSNNSFNLNLFLNETCKGALNISEFIETIKVQLQDLENVGKLGYIEGISKIIIRGLKELDVTKRPIHCSDLKRETLYVKNDNIWENDKEKEKMKYTIQHIAGKNFKQIPIWVKENPLSKDSESKKHLEYMRIINKSTGGMTEEEDEQNYNKIIKRVANEVIINK